MNHSSILEKFDDNPWGYHIKINNDVAESLINKDDRRVICTLNDAHIFSCAVMPNHGNYIISVNKEIRNKLNLSIGNQVSYSLKKDESKYGMPLPEELKELLEIDDEASHYFHKLTPGKQRSLLYLIGKPKTSETRLNKAIAITEYLKDTRGKVDFPEMNQFIKDYNRL